MAQLRVDLADYEGQHKYAKYSYKSLQYIIINTYIYTVSRNMLGVTNTFILYCIYLLTVIAAKLLTTHIHTDTLG